MKPEALLEAKMSLEDGKEYTAHCVEERVNVGGWVAYESDARRNRDLHLEQHQDHQVQIRARDHEDTGPGTVIG